MTQNSNICVCVILVEFAQIMNLPANRAQNYLPVLFRLAFLSSSRADIVLPCMFRRPAKLARDYRATAEQSERRAKKRNCVNLYALIFCIIKRK